MLKYIALSLLLINAVEAKVETKLQEKKSLVTACAELRIAKNDICSKAITLTKLEDKSLELTEDLLEKLDQKGLEYDIIRVSNESKLLNCQDINEAYQTQICIDRTKINAYDKKDTALLVEDLF